MTTPYTLKQLTDVEDAAVKFGISEVQEARFAGRDLDAEKTGLALLCVKAGKRQAFGHKHDLAEEVYVVLAGSGRVKLDDAIVDVGRLDAIRVAPGVMRAFEAAPDSDLELLAVGARHDSDGEVVQGWWAD